MNATLDKMMLKLDIKDSIKLINERNEKTLFLFLFLFWLPNVVASISSTSQGFVLVLFPKNVEDSLLQFIFRIIPGEGTHIIVVAVCNFLVDLIIFSLFMIPKNRFEINRKKTIYLLLTGHLIGVVLYVVGLANQNIEAIKASLIGIFLFGSLYYIIFRYFPKKYMEILSPYSIIFLAQEIHTLKGTNKRSDYDRDIKNSKKRLGLYLNTLNLILQKDNTEKDLIVLIRKWRAIHQQEGKPNTKVIDDFCNYLYSKFAIQISGSEFVFAQTPKGNNFLRGIIIKVDNIIALLIYSPRYSTIIDLIDKSLTSTRNSDIGMPLIYDDKNISKIIKYHLNRAQEGDVVSARQKVYANMALAFVYLIFPTLIYVIRMNENESQFSQYRFILLFIQYFSAFVFAHVSTDLIQKRFRRSGINLFIPNKFLGYFVDGILFLIFFTIVVSTSELVHQFIVSFFIQNLWLFLVGIAILQILLLFMFIKPPAELLKHSTATSFLVRELILLRSQILGSQSLRERRRIGRHIYFSKKYFNFVAKELIYSRYDSASQKTHLRDYFSSINDYLDNISAQVKLGAKQNREKAIDQIEILIFVVAIEKFGEIPNIIPEIKKVWI